MTSPIPLGRSGPGSGGQRQLALGVTDKTIQANLALALALVEHASSNGGRAEALFLDEGSGTLDQTSLPEGQDALFTQADAGRLVVVISHMLAVAQHVSSLLRVTKSPTAAP